MSDKISTIDLDIIDYYFKNESKGEWIEPEVKSIPCEFEFEISPIEDLTEGELNDRYQK